MSIAIPSHLTDAELVAAVRDLAGDEREVTARVVAHLAEIDARQLYLAAGYSSLFIYCHEGLGYSEDAAYNRKTAARVARRFPEIVDMLADGRLTLTAVRLLAPVLDDENRERAFAEAAGKSKRDVERLVAALAPKPDVPSSVRRLPMTAVGTPSTPVPTDAPTTAAAVPERETPDTAGGPTPPQASQPAPRGKKSEVAPLAPERYRVQFTIGAETEKKLRRLQELLKREIPDGDPAVLFDRALTVLLEKMERRRNGVAAKPRAGRTVKRGSRHVPAATRRAVSPRDGGQCTFVSADGRRCTERAYMEFHHRGVPFAQGGGPGPDNIALHCRAHNAYEGRRIFGAHLPKEIREARAQYDAMRFAVPERRETRVL
jgi:hypothetical protein